MSASFRRIDYSLRPAKHAERRMLVEVFRHLRPFQPVEDYLYVGFGSVWFSDFILFHRLLGVRDMLSIERSAGARERVKANVPFGAIKIEFEESKYVLPRLDWNRRQFIWLDYDDPLSEDMLMDMRTVASRARSGTVLAVTLQCHQAPDIAAANRDPSGPSAKVRFTTRLGRERLPGDFAEDDLVGWPFGKLSRTMLQSEIRAALAIRNSDVDDGKVHDFTPVCEIEYEDGAKMTTIVGIFSSKDEDHKVNECHFDQLDFLRNGQKKLRIEIPRLTVREIRRLEQQLPCVDGVELELGPIPPSDAKLFADLYRYLPNFAILES